MVEVIQPAMRDTDYLTRHVDLDVTGLGPDVKTWHAGPGIPPLFIERAGDALGTFAAFRAWLAEHRSRVDELIYEYGGVMLRGFPLTSAEEFNSLMSVFEAYEPGYVAGMSPRKVVEGQVLESTRLDEGFKIMLHSEMAYMKAYPPRIALFSKTTAPIGGETIIGNMDEFMARMPAELRERLERDHVHIVRSFAPAGASRNKESVDHPGNIGWDDAFFTEERDVVEQKCRELGIDFSWNEDGSLTLKEVTPVFTRHPRDGKPYYRNNLHTMTSFSRQGLGDLDEQIRTRQKDPTGHYLDDGGLLSPEDTAIVLDLYDQIELAWRWQDGDVAILDNLKTAHGRNPFSGPREVLVALLN